MADITMCEGTGCKRKEECYRFTAKVNEHRQTYFEQVPLQKDNTCNYFGDNSQSESLRRI